MIRRLLHNRPTEDDKKYLELYLGGKRAEKMIAHAYHIRKLHKEEIKEQGQAISSLQAERKTLVQDISKKNEKVIRENEIFPDIVEEVCYSSPFSIMKCLISLHCVIILSKFHIRAPAKKSGQSPLLLRLEKWINH